MGPISSPPTSPAGPARQFWAWLIFAIVISGVVIRVAEYAADRSLWLDEAAVANDILEQPLFDLATGRLERSQVAPPGFSLAVRAVTALGGAGERMLRLVPFLAGVAALVLVAWFAWRRLPSIGAAVAAALAAWSWPLVYYSNECKQYSTDALCAVLLFYLAEKISGQPLRLRRAAALGLLGCGALFLSQPALFGLAALGVCGILEVTARRRWQETLCWMAVGGVWLAFFAFLMALSYRSTLGNQALFNYHEDAFLRLWPPAEAYRAWRDNLEGSWITATGGNWKMWTILLGAGFAVGGRKQPRATAYIFLTLASVAGASLLHFYPLPVRLVLFLFPLLFWLVGQGTGWFAGLLKGRAAWLLAPLLLWSAWPLARDEVVEFRHPSAPEHLRPVVEKLAAQVRPGDVVLTFDLTHEAFGYYWPRLPHAGVAVDDVIFEQDEPMSAADLAAKIAPFLKGNPPHVWLVATHYDYGAAPGNLRMLVAVLRQRYPGAADFVPPGGTAQGVVFYHPDARPAGLP